MDFDIAMNNIYFKQTLKILYKNICDDLKCRKNEKSFHLDKRKKYAFVFLAADYNNLGDMAITIAQRQMLEKLLPGYSVIEVPKSEVFIYIKMIQEIPVQNALITLIGGGNNGTLYEFLEQPRRLILRKLKNYRIISFPQSVFYAETARGIPYKKAFSKICNRCKNLTLTAREKESFDKYRSITNTNVILTPDTVFSLSLPTNLGNQSKKVAAIFRDDKEKAITSDFQKSIIEIIEENGYEIYHQDTCSVDIDNGVENELNNYINELRKVKFAVTDRLHGMILCYVTKTPCIVFGISNSKIDSTYSTWLNHQNFIFLLHGNENKEEMVKYIRSIESIEKINYKSLENEFAPLYKTIKELTDYSAR